MKARFIALSLLLIAAVSAAIVHAWPQLPEVVAVHWNWRGEADGFAPRAVLWLLGPGLMAFIMLLAVLLPPLSPRDLAQQLPSYSDPALPLAPALVDAVTAFVRAP